MAQVRTRAPTIGRGRELGVFSSLRRKSEDLKLVGAAMTPEKEMGFPLGKKVPVLMAEGWHRAREGK